MPLDALLSRHARYRPQHTAVVFEDERITFAELDSRVNRIANALLGLGLTKGDKVASVLENCVEVIELYQAAARTGLVVVPLSPLLRGSGLTNLVTDSNARALVTNVALVPELDRVRADLAGIPAGHFLLVDGEAAGYRSYRELAQAASEEPPPPVAIDRDDPFNIIYSSGTTGLPKGIVHTHAIREAYGTGFASSYRIQPESVVIHSGSLVFNGAFLTLMPAFYLGSTYVLLRGFDADRMVEAIERERATHVMLVPSQLVALLQRPNFDEVRCGSLEMICSVGAPLHLEHKQELARRLPRRFYELYGLTEGFVTVLDRDDFARKQGSVGIPPPLYEMRIVDLDGTDLPPGEVGEIVGRGPITMPGYYERPDLTAETIREGWIFTGDLGYVDADGYLYLVDRKKDLIISGGVNVYPRDIEEVVVQHQAVAEVAVFGVADEHWGETPVAAVTLRPGETASAEELKRWVNERVEARYQKLADVLVLDSFPQNAAGKTLRREIRTTYLRRNGESS
jgi:acyl-CoA synthetase (AMP-forming)/AMP-acid ligase II